MKCEGIIRIVPYFDKDLNITVVSHGSCDVCFRNVVLPQEEYIDFIRRNGKNLGKCEKEIYWGGTFKDEEE